MTSTTKRSWPGATDEKIGFHADSIGKRQRMVYTEVGEISKHGRAFSCLYETCVTNTRSYESLYL